MNKYKKEIEALVRAIIQDKGKILVCKNVEKGYYFFPGGHVKFGESPKEALTRELKEELGLKIKKCNFIGGSEHLFTEDGKKYHEINLVFDVKINKLKIQSREDHIEFYLKTKEQLLKEKTLPVILTKAILKWLKNKRPFWATNFNEKLP